MPVPPWADSRQPTPRRQPEKGRLFAPYLLTALITRPDRLIYLSKRDAPQRHAQRRGSRLGLPAVECTQAYSDSKLFDATLAFAIARRWPAVLSNALEPGWVPTKMGGAGHRTISRKLTSPRRGWPSATLRKSPVSGQYFYHQSPAPPHLAVRSVEFQDALVEALAELTGVTLSST